MHKVRPHKTVEQIAKKHRVEVSFVKKQLDVGIPIEHEHTKDKDLATDIALQHLDEIPDYYTRLKKMESSAKKNVNEDKQYELEAILELENGLKKLNNTSYDSIDKLMRKIMKNHNLTAKQLHNSFVKKHNKTPDSWIKELKEGTLHHWFKGSKSKDGKPGWVQADGSPCANEPGETKTPKCFSSARLKALKSKGKKGESLIKSAVRRKRNEDEGQQSKSGAAKPTMVSTFARGKKDPNYVKAEPGIKEAMELNEAQKDKPGKGSGKKDACYNKVKARYDVWPSAYASGALVKCRKVGAANWGTKSEETQMIRYCPKCKKDETRDECKYGPKYWDMYSVPVKLGKHYDPNGPHPGNFPESYDHEHSMARSEISTIISAAKRLRKKMKGEGNIEAWVQSKITKAADYLDSTADYVDSGEMKEEIVAIQKPPTREEKRKIRKMQELERLRRIAKAPKHQSDVAKESVTIEDIDGNSFAEVIDIIGPNQMQPVVDEGCWKGYKQVGMKKKGDKMVPNCVKEEYSNWREELAEDWQKVNRQDKTDGLSQKAVNAYRRENPGSKLQTAVTEKKPTGKRAKRRASFCRRMSGMKSKLTSAKTARDPDSRINKALRRWNCN